MSLRDKMLAVIDDVNGSVAERGELVEIIAIALLTRKNLFVLGDPGQAKSYAINLFRQHITGARQFERLLSKQTDEEQLFGRVDLSSLIPGSILNSALEGDDVYRNLRFDLKCAVDGLGQMKNAQDTFAMLDRASDKLAAYRKAVALLRPSEPVVQTVGKIPEADIVLLDEIFKCNDGVLNSLLTALNERKYTNEGHTWRYYDSLFAAEHPEFYEYNSRDFVGTTYFQGTPGVSYRVTLTVYSSSSQIPLTQVRHYIHLTNSCRTLHFPRNLKPNMP